MGTLSRSQRFFVLFAASALGMYLLLLSAPVRPLVEGYSGALARAAGWLVRVGGGICEQREAVMSNPLRGFAMEVRDGCNGVNVVILLWAAILGYPASRQKKMWGLGLGFGAIQSLNLLRIISLFYLGQYYRQLFDFAHLYVWELLIILDAMVVFAMWTRRVRAQ
jgi:exosortase H (IPTLxxWG-CTERM-specific)